jgi:CRISPR-associated protein Csb2
MGIQGKRAEIPGVVSRTFSGKTADGQPLSGHEHLFILPLGNYKGRIDRVLLYTRAKDGFNKKEVEAILLLRTLYTKNAAEPIRTVVTWKGKAADVPLLRKAQVAVSRTPFIMTRHWRPGRGDFSSFLAEEVRRECRNHGLREPREVEILRGMPGLRSMPALFEAVEYRRNRKDDDPRPGFPLRLTFAEPVTLPFSLGYGCHFGLGQFGPEENP